MTPRDHAALWGLLAPFVGAGRSADGYFAEMLGVPVPKARPRVALQRGKAHAYTPARSEAAEDMLSLMMRAARRGQPTIARPVVAAAIFVFARRPRVDGDNLQKLVWDAGTKAGAWTDDSLVDAWAGLVVYPGSAIEPVDTSTPRTLVAWSAL